MPLEPPAAGDSAPAAVGRAELLLGRLLRVGVLLAAGIVLAAGVLYLVRHGGERPELGAFHGEPESLSTVRGIFAGVLTLRARALIQVGLLLLIATPVLRVALSVVLFALHRDRTYVVITLIVLALLLNSLFNGAP